MLQQYITEFIITTCGEKVNETPAAYKTKLGYLARYLGDVETITQQDINNFRGWITSKDAKVNGGALSRFTIRSVIAATRYFLRWGSHQGYWPEITIRNISEPTPQPKSIEESTVTRLITAAASTGAAWEQARNTALIYLLRDTGCRVGAVVGLEVHNINFKAGWATSTTKGDKLTYLFFSPPTRAALRVWLAEREQIGPQDTRVFTSARGTGLTRSGIYKILKRLGQAGGCSGRLNPHAFRHGYARDSILAGADISQVSQLLGHTSIVVTAKYYSRWANHELLKVHQATSPGRALPAPALGQGSAKP